MTEKERKQPKVRCSAHFKAENGTKPREGIRTCVGGIEWCGGVCRMLSPVIYLVMNGLFFTLRLSGGGGSFPRPLKAAEEREYLQRCAEGDLEARNILVEHNLRLVAHIVKNG